MRLIDADDAINIFTNRLFETLKTHLPCVTAEENQICLDTCYKVARYEIDNIPTAYDVEKVVAELEKLKNTGSVTKTEMLITKACVNKAIEIVRKGGVE